MTMVAAMRSVGIKLPAALAIGFLLSGCYATPERPAEVSTGFDGAWAGELSKATGCPSELVTLEGEVAGGLARFFLSHTGRDVSGWIRPDGRMVLRNHTHQYTVYFRSQFDGQAQGDRIEGSFSLSDSCAGNWYVERRGG